FLATIKNAYPDLAYIVIVGGDEIVPFRRVPDEVPVANESTYLEGLLDTTPLGAALTQSYFLSDTYYSGFAPIPWRGRELVLPEYELGRLVETPEEMMAAIDTFLQTPVITVTTGLVTGYDFLSDHGYAVQSELESKGLTVTTVISDFWQADALQTTWLDQPYGVQSINAHFSHSRAIPAETAGGVLTPTDVAASTELASSLIFSVGCHSGLSVADGQAVPGQNLDFAQVLLGQGATYVANTGYAYGDGDAIGYSEKLMDYFAQHLETGGTVGQALQLAKLDYLNNMGIHSLTIYDEKVLNVATLYGLPMLQLSFPAETAVSTPTSFFQLPPLSWRQTGTCTAEALCTETVMITPNFGVEMVNGTAVNGQYFTVEGQTQTIAGYPIQPLTSQDISQPDTIARGILFEGGVYETVPSFNPVVTRVITDDSRIDLWQQEPEFAVFNSWTPSTWSLINSVRKAEGIQQQLVTIPAQYKATTGSLGTARKMTELTYTIYYSVTNDYVPPSIWAVDQLADSPDTIALAVEVTDFSANIMRVVATYTIGDGLWYSVDLAPDGENIWRTTANASLPRSDKLEFFVQAVDASGNVAIHDNKGHYFGLGIFEIYLPVVLTH
ncbi:MAG: hypothetical protein KC445_08790, partial [Anaerolineales bacterium]|nr:hypothetical protein [Anaerolineales bacterium]